MGMGMKSLKWEGIGTKNLFPHTSTMQLSGVRLSVRLSLIHLTLLRFDAERPTGRQYTP